MVFTDTGISGPVILRLSRQVIPHLQNHDKVVISFDLKPALDMEKLDARILRDFNAKPKQYFKTALKNFLPPKIIPVCIDQTGIPSDKPLHRISSDERKLFRMWLKDFRMTITGHRGYDEAIITSGGVNLKEIDPATMKSKIIDGLYIIGELLDLDANTGGYNLQAAFSTGWIAGMSVSK